MTQSRWAEGSHDPYLYDGSGRRVSKSSGKLYWYGSGGEILAETSATGATLNEYIFFGGKRVAMLPAGGWATLMRQPDFDFCLSLGWPMLCGFCKAWVTPLSDSADFKLFRAFPLPYQMS